MLKFESVGFSNHVKFYQGSKNHDRAYLVLELIEQYISNRTRIDEFTIEHVCPDSEMDGNAQIGNLIPLEEDLNHVCDNKSYKEKLGIYENSNFATARRLAKRIKKDNGNFDPRNRSVYLGKLLYENITNYVKEDNLLNLSFIKKG